MIFLLSALASAAPYRRQNTTTGVVTSCIKPGTAALTFVGSIAYQILTNTDTTPRTTVRIISRKYFEPFHNNTQA